MESRSSSSSRRIASWMRLLPAGVCHRRCSQTVWPQFVAAELGERADDLLDVGDLSAGEASAAEGGGLEILDQRVQSDYPPHSTCQNWPLKSSAFAKKSVLSHKLLISNRLRSESTRSKAPHTR